MSPAIRPSQEGPLGSIHSRLKLQRAGVRGARHQDPAGKWHKLRQALALPASSLQLPAAHGGLARALLEQRRAGAAPIAAAGCNRSRRASQQHLGALRGWPHCGAAQPASAGAVASVFNDNRFCTLTQQRLGQTAAVSSSSSRSPNQARLQATARSRLARQRLEGQAGIRAALPGGRGATGRGELPAPGPGSQTGRCCACCADWRH